MNIHLPAILGFTRGTRFWPIPICPIFSHSFQHLFHPQSSLDGRYTQWERRAVSCEKTHASVKRPVLCVPIDTPGRNPIASYATNHVSKHESTINDNSLCFLVNPPSTNQFPGKPAPSISKMMRKGTSTRRSCCGYHFTYLLLILFDVAIQYIHRFISFVIWLCVII